MKIKLKQLSLAIQYKYKRAVSIRFVKFEHIIRFK